MLHHRVYERGAGLPWVVFVHGAGGSSAVWFRQVRAYREHFNVVLVDLRGHGGSAGIRDGRERAHYTFADVSREVVQVLDHLRLSKAHFVGISLGCIIIRTIAEQAPGRVSSMILGGAVTRLNVRSRVLVAIGNAVKRFVPFMWLYSLFAWIIMPRANHRESRILFVNEARKLYRQEFLRWFKMTYEVTPLLRLFEEQEPTVPTLYMMGGEDHMFLPPVRRLVARHGNSRLHVIDNCGHVCNVEQPARFNEATIEFIHELESAAA